LTDDELKLKEKILPDLYRHFKENPKSLISKVYGVYSVKMKNYNAVNLILMENTLKFSDKKNIKRIYDLKGSRTKRYVKTKSALSSSTLKDMNFLENKSYVQEINLSRSQRISLRKIIQADTQMLSELGIMDYSLLLGIENRLNTGDSFNESFVENKFDESSLKRHR
jgi:1-phosphatidylinositol-4-phosphate 5-kinase